MRSSLMARIRGRDTDPEIVLRHSLHAAGFRYRLRQVVAGIRPDLVLPRWKAVLFVDGCFWHGCPEHYVRPRSRTDFWDAKLAQNVDRDRRQTKRLDEAGWLVLRLWEHAVMEDPDGAVRVINRALRDGCTPLSDWRVIWVEALSRDGNLERRMLGRLHGNNRVRVEVRKRTTRKWKRRHRS